MHVLTTLSITDCKLIIDRPSPSGNSASKYNSEDLQRFLKENPDLFTIEFEPVGYHGLSIGVDAYNTERFSGLVVFSLSIPILAYHEKL